MNERATLYSVPEAIASELHLTRIRVHDGKGFYLLSASDLRPYGIAQALAEGAVTVTAEEAKEKFFNQNL